ncbi:MAG: hypothetical protein ABIA67_00365 [Candidatus Margulisiibacteriota bacterium]
MPKIWVKKFDSFKKADEAELEYYLKMSPEEKLSVVQMLRENYHKLTGAKKHVGSDRLRRTIKIIKQT